MGPARAAEIVTALPASVSAVGVFVDRPAREVAALAAQLGLRIVQLHGQEPASDLLALDHLQIVRAFRVDGVGTWTKVTDYLSQCRAIGRLPDAVLIDAYIPGTHGGTGATIAYDLLDFIPPLPRLVLAGGLTAMNVAERVVRVRPWMVDVASGVESSPGRKDLARVTAFIAAARAALGERDESVSSLPDPIWKNHERVDKRHRDL